MEKKVDGLYTPRSPGGKLTGFDMTSRRYHWTSSRMLISGDAKATSLAKRCQADGPQHTIWAFKTEQNSISREPIDSRN